MDVVVVVCFLFGCERGRREKKQSREQLCRRCGGDGVVVVKSSGQLLACEWRVNILKFSRMNKHRVVLSIVVVLMVVVVVV
mgnify:FL=1